MIGIYKITNLINQKSYIGQSNNIERRKTEHFSNNNYDQSVIDKAIQLEGIENFKFEVLEECTNEQLDEREKYWIAYYNTYENGYNRTRGGQGSFCGQPKLERDDVVKIRQAYNNHEYWYDVYKQFQDKIGIDGFKHIWQGNRWKFIMPEVYTEENKNYYKQIGQFKKGEMNENSKLSDQEIINIRKRYQTETATQIWQDYKYLYTLGSFKQILTGVKYSHLPIYKKAQKTWINVEGYDGFKESN